MNALIDAFHISESCLLDDWCSPTVKPVVFSLKRFMRVSECSNIQQSFVLSHKLDPCVCASCLYPRICFLCPLCAYYTIKVCVRVRQVCVCVYMCSCCFRLWALCPVALSMSASSGELGLSLVWPHKGTAFLWGVKNFHLCIPWTKSSWTHFRGHWQHRQTLWPRFFCTHFTDSKTGMWWTGFQQLKCPVRAWAIREREKARTAGSP